MKIVLVTCRTATFEMESDEPYFFKAAFDIYLDSIFIKEEKRNVFSLTNLKPNTSYIVRAGEQELSFVTKEETACFNVLDFGAFGDGERNDTLSFVAAINTLPKGGTLFVPKGRFLVTSLFLKSDMTLYLSEGTVILGDIIRGNFPILPGIINSNGREYNLGTWEGDEVKCFASTINTYEVHNIDITGDGIIDMRSVEGDWYERHREMRGAWRPFGLFISHSSHINISCISLHNSPSWNLHPYFSTNMIIADLKITNPFSMPTTDGIDPDCSKDIDIVGVFISVGDDCIAIKSGQLELAKKHNSPSERIVIRNCLMERGHGGVVFGSESSGGIKDISVSQCIFDSTDRGLRIKTRRGRGKVDIIDRVYFDNIIMKNVLTPFVINMFYNMGPVGGHDEYAWTREKLPVDERTPYLGEFHFKNMKCYNCHYAAGVFLGLPEAPIGGVTLENVEFTYDENASCGSPAMIEHNFEVSKMGLYFDFVSKVKLKNIKITGNHGDRVILNKTVENYEEI